IPGRNLEPQGRTARYQRAVWGNNSVEDPVQPRGSKNGKGSMRQIDGRLTIFNRDSVRNRQGGSTKNPVERLFCRGVGIPPNRQENDPAHQNQKCSAADEQPSLDRIIRAHALSSSRMRRK